MSCRKVCLLVVLWCFSVMMAFFIAWVWRDILSRRENCEFRLHVRGCIEEFGVKLKACRKWMDCGKDIDIFLNELQISISKQRVKDKAGHALNMSHD